MDYTIQIRKGFYVKYLIFIIIAVFGLSSLSFAQTSITIPDEATVTNNKAKVDTVLILMNTKTAKVTMKHGHNPGGGFVDSGKSRTFVFRDIVDDPATVEDETDTSFTDFLSTLTINRPALRALITSKY